MKSLHFTVTEKNPKDPEKYPKMEITNFCAQVLNSSEAYPETPIHAHTFVFHPQRSTWQTFHPHRVWVCERGRTTATTATIAGYASSANVSHPLVRQFTRIDPKNITWLYGEGVRDRGQWSPKDQGRGGGRDTVQRVCRDRRHVESLCRDSSCAMCVVCCKRDAARHTAQPRDAMLFCKSWGGTSRGNVLDVIPWSISRWLYGSAKILYRVIKHQCYKYCL